MTEPVDDYTDTQIGIIAFACGIKAQFIGKDGPYTSPEILKFARELFALHKAGGNYAGADCHIHKVPQFVAHTMLRDPAIRGRLSTLLQSKERGDAADFICAIMEYLAHNPDQKKVYNGWADVDILVKQTQYLSALFEKETGEKFTGSDQINQFVLSRINQVKVEKKKNAALRKKLSMIAKNIEALAVDKEEEAIEPEVTYIEGRG